MTVYQLAKEYQSRDGTVGILAESFLRAYEALKEIDLYNGSPELEHGYMHALAIWGMKGGIRPDPVAMFGGEDYADAKTE